MQLTKIIVCGDFRAVHPEKITVCPELRKIFDDADICVCNFEAPIRVEGAKPIKKSGPALNQSPQSPTFLKENGFNVILLANNHIMDYGREGCESTIKAFSNAITVGAGNARDAYKVCIADIKGKKIGLLCLVQNEFGTVEGKDDNAYGTAWINSPDVPIIIKEAKNECDYLLVLPHAGVEHTKAPLPEWRKLYKRFIDLGADVVIASHPHCPQGWETYKGKTIYYSLGDFYFDELTYDEWWYKSLVVELTVDEKIIVKAHYACFDDKTGAITIDNSEQMRDYMMEVNHLLQEDEEYKRYIDKMCATRWPGIKYGLLRGVCGVSLGMRLKYIIRLLGCTLLGNKDEMYLLNALRCESHRWVIERYLINKNIKSK